jgi:hypothetical protein
VTLISPALAVERAVIIKIMLGQLAELGYNLTDSVMFRAVRGLQAIKDFGFFK